MIDAILTTKLFSFAHDWGVEGLGGNPETGVFVIGFRQEQRTHTSLVHSISRETEKFA